MLRATGMVQSRYLPVVGCAFLVELLYGSKFSPHMGTYSLPYVYVKTMLYTASADGLDELERKYIQGLIELLLPTNVSQDNLTKLELAHFVESIPARRRTEKHGVEGVVAAEPVTGATARAETRSGGETPSTAPTADRTAPADAEPNQLPTSAPQSPPEVGPSTADQAPGFSEAQREEQAASPHYQQAALLASVLLSKGSPTHYASRTAEKASRFSVHSLAATGDLTHQSQELHETLINETVTSFLSGPLLTSPMLSRVLVYDAVSACVADTVYSAREKERLRRVSTQLGVPSTLRERIESLAIHERRLSNRKRRLLFTP